jgi:hypothetical protein
VSSNLCFWGPIDNSVLTPGSAQNGQYPGGTQRNSIKDISGVNAHMKIFSVTGASPFGWYGNSLDNNILSGAVACGYDIRQEDLWDPYKASEDPFDREYHAKFMASCCASAGSIDPAFLGCPCPSSFRWIPRWNDYYGYSMTIQGNEIFTREGVGNTENPAAGTSLPYVSFPTDLRLNTSQLADVIIGSNLLALDAQGGPFGGFTVDTSYNVMPPFNSNYYPAGTGAGTSQNGVGLAIDLGASNRRFGNLYLYGNVLNTSSSDAKSDIQNSSFGREFINRLTPRQYKMNGGRTTQFGFVAQEVRDVLKNDEKLPFDGEATNSFGGYKFFPGRTEESFTKLEKEAGTIRDKSGNIVRETWRYDMSDNYYLNYSEFIAPMVKAIQEVDAKWLTDQEGGTYKTSGGLAIGTIPLTGTPLSLYGGGGNLDATILRIEGKNQSMNGSGGIINYEVNSSSSYTVTHKLNNSGYSILHNTSTRSMSFGTNKTERIVIRGTGGVLINGEPVLTSDDRIKHNEVDISNTMHIIRKLKPKQYFKTPVLYDANHNFALDSNGNPIDGSGNQVDHYVETGFIAQEVKSISELAHCVSGDESKEILGLNYNNVFVCSIAGLQEIDREQQADKVKIATLETEVATLKTQMASVLARLAALEGSG